MLVKSDDNDADGYGTIIMMRLKVLANASGSDNYNFLTLAHDDNGISMIMV